MKYITIVVAATGIKDASYMLCVVLNHVKIGYANNGMSIHANVTPTYVKNRTLVPALGGMVQMRLRDVPFMAR